MMSLDAQSRQLAAQANRAAHLAVGCFFTTEVIAAWVLVRWGFASLIRLHWLIKFVVLLIGIFLSSYVLMRLSLNGIAPDPVFDLEPKLHDWFMRMAA